MKILHVIPSIAPVRGGPSQAVLAMVKALRQQGVEVEIATTNDNGDCFLDVPLGERTIYQEVPVWFLPRFVLPMKEFIFSAELTKWLWQNIRDYDLVHNHYLFSYASSCAGFLARKNRIPYIVRTIGQLTPWALEQSRLKKQIYTSAIERRNLDRAAAIHCTTAEEAEDVRKFGIDTQTITLPLGVDAPATIPTAKLRLCQLYGIPQDRQIILFLSRLHYKKRPDLIIKCLPEIITANSQAHLIIAGSGEKDYINYLRQLVRDNQLSDRITFAGFVTGDEKQIVLQGADVFVLPSYSENFGIAVAEAMIAGLPVIITPGVQIAPEVSTARAGIVIDGETELINGINTLLDSEERRLQFSRNAIVLARQRYSWSNIASQLIASYSEINALSLAQ